MAEKSSKAYNLFKSEALPRRWLQQPGERDSDRQAGSSLTLQSRIDWPLLVYSGDIYLTEATEEEEKFIRPYS